MSKNTRNAFSLVHGYCTIDFDRNGKINKMIPCGYKASVLVKEDNLVFNDVHRYWEMINENIRTSCDPFIRHKLAAGLGLVEHEMDVSPDMLEKMFDFLTAIKNGISRTGISFFVFNLCVLYAAHKTGIRKAIKFGPSLKHPGVIQFYPITEDMVERFRYEMNLLGLVDNDSYQVKKNPDNSYIIDVGGIVYS